MKWSVGSLSINNISADLISAKLSGKRDYHKLYIEMTAEIETYIEKKWMHPSTLTAIEDIFKYLQNH
jgi:hypothetical protein